MWNIKLHQWGMLRPQRCYFHKRSQGEQKCRANIGIVLVMQLMDWFGGWSPEPWVVCCCNLWGSQDGEMADANRSDVISGIYIPKDWRCRCSLEFLICSPLSHLFLLFTTW